MDSTAARYAARGLGIDGRRIKWLVYVASGAGCAMAGALIFITKLRVSPDAAFSIDWSTTMFFVVVVGGIGTLEGPLVGAVVYFLLREWLSELGSIYLIVLGTLTMTVMLVAPGGLWGLFSRRVPLQLFPVQRRVRLVDKG